MKKLTHNLLWHYVVDTLVATLLAVAVYWYFEFWELAVLVWLLVVAGSLRDSISTYFGLRRNPEYRKDVKDKD
ncbi:hypothetical protein [Pseudodesulfovibrio indicus]|uniref:hypothetical protein n=1 Tax=Pseudodesulfovibrio indicus TaxID=1716143 RepID=UPI0029300428|nr:hypothetical protein [Pseudodesulfovibrio indicus]